MQTLQAADQQTRKSVFRSARRLITRPGGLMLSLLLLSALFRPYAGIVHDARFYAVQTLHRTTPEAHADDLYLKYGSQDSYSLFSLLTAPLTETIGIPATFFLLYLGGNACWLFAMQRFVPRLQGRTLAALGALIYLAVNPLPFGGFHIFQVNENFLTPRLWAIALVVLGLERLLRGRLASSLAWMLSSMLLHPIMGFSGLCIWVLCYMLESLPPKTFLKLLLGGLAGLMGVLLYEPLGTAVFGRMDDEWMQYVVAANCYCVPSEWRFNDWLAIATAFAIVATGRTCLRLTPVAKRMLDAMLLLAATGLAIGFAAPFLPYKLLLQGQAYRAVWPLQFVQIPMLFALIGCLVNGRLSAAGCRATLFVLLNFAAALMNAWKIAATLPLLAAVYCWRKAGREEDPARRRVLRRRALLALSVGLLLAIALIATAYSTSLSYAPLARVAAVPMVIGPFLTWSVAVCLLLVLHRLFRKQTLYLGVAACGWLWVQSAFFLAPENSLYKPAGVEERQDVAFVEEYLAETRARAGRTPVLYWPPGSLDDIWLRLGCNSFYSVWQTAGNMFNRETAIEGHRRARLTREFELDVRRASHDCSRPGVRRRMRRMFGKIWDAEPTAGDLIKLCREEEIDLIIVPNRFDGWYTANNGRLFIYEARRIRELLASGTPTHVGAGPVDFSETAGSRSYSLQ